ncbi:leucine-rich repeat-containing protein 66 [Mustela putorius furo]|uniref:Leucine-rich repeat-containing protein 66 n=5 Tax=Mustela putorius furo TaxID=9669 RepID=A0A8U0T1C0_MUSPF|nr:leucine-rich repeat-containing protein 66 [Mustela putorius furo]
MHTVTVARGQNLEDERAKVSRGREAPRADGWSFKGSGLNPHPPGCIQTETHLRTTQGPEGIMKNLHFQVLTMLTGLYFTGTMTNPSRKGSILFSSECQWNGHLLTNCSFTGKHDTRADMPRAAATLDASASFLRDLIQSRVRKDRNIKHLDLSNNHISNISLSPLAHFHTLEILNLSNGSIRSLSLDLPSAKSSWGKCHRSSGRHGLPFLKLLILQRNKLTDIPKGLRNLKSLQSLDLSFNEITQIGPSDLRNCPRLENLYLKSNKIFRIHPEAFKDLKKLQVVDLSNNVLTAILPMMVIALALPHLEVDLADNPWQCDYSMAAFQNVISDSWRKTWNGICSESVGDEEAYWWTPQSRSSRETHLPHHPTKPVKSLPPGRAERPPAGGFEHSDTPAAVGAPASGRPHRRSRWARSPRDVPAAGRKGAPSQDLALAVCLAVFITFFVAFCLGAFARPFIDRLWHQRCRRKGPSSDRADNADNADNAYWNEGFCSDMEASGKAQHRRTDRPLQEPAGPRAAVIPDGATGESRREQGHRRSGGLGSDSRGPGGEKDDIRLSDHAARSAPPGRPNAGHNQRIPAGQDHIRKEYVLGEVNYATGAQEGSPRTPPGEMAASLSKMQMPVNAQRAGENERFPLEFSKEMQGGGYLNLLDTQQQRLQETSAEEGPPASHSAVPLRDWGEQSPAPPIFPPGWGHDPQVTPANVEPVQKWAPSSPQYTMDCNYDSDSDEGSLFTLSSTSSEGARNETEEETRGRESHGASEPPEDGDSGVRKDYVTSLEDPDDHIPCQRILEECENQEDCFAKPLISGPDSGLCETHLEGASDTDTCEGPWTLPALLGGNSPSSDELPGTVLSDYAAALLSETVTWHHSLRDLEFFNADVIPQTPPWPAEGPSDPDESNSHERDSDVYKHEACLQEVNTVQHDIPLKITAGETSQPAQQHSEGGHRNSHPMDTDASQGFVCPLEDSDSRKVRSRTQVLQSSSDEPTLQGERGEGDCAENGSRSQTPSFQEPPDEPSSPGTREPIADRQGSKYSEANLLQSETDHVHVHVQRQTRGHLRGAGRLHEGLLYYDAELENQRELK